MKFFITLILVIATLMTVKLFAEEPPPALKDGEITVKLKDGNTAKFSENQWKVVPRVDKPKVAKKPEVKEEPKVVVKESKNKIRILGGVGPQGYHLKQSSTEVNVANRNKDVFGLSYDRKVYKMFSVGGEAITNGTYLLDVGVDF